MHACGDVEHAASQGGDGRLALLEGILRKAVALLMVRLPFLSVI